MRGPGGFGFFKDYESPVGKRRDVPMGARTTGNTVNSLKLVMS